MSGHDPYAPPVVDHPFISAVVRGVKLPAGDRLQILVGDRVLAEVSVREIKKVLWKLQS